MSNNLTKVFSTALQKGFDAAKLIVEPKDKALAYAELVKAIAQTGLVVDTEIIEEIKEKETKKKSGKDSLKAESGKGKKKTEEPVEQAPVDETPKASEVTEDIEEDIPEEDDNWESEAIREAKNDQLELLQEYVTAWGEDYVYNTLLEAWSEGTFSGVENVRPSNIDGFLAYIAELVKQNESEAQ